MNKQILCLLSLFVLVTTLPACGKKDMKKTDKKVHHKKYHHPKKKHTKKIETTHEYVVETMHDENMK